MPRPPLSVEEYREMIQARVNRLTNKPRGAKAADLGYEFQEFVCIVELIKLAVKSFTDDDIDMHIQRQGPSEVDDIHIRIGRDRRFIQVKGEASPSWTRDLVLDFWADHEKFGGDQSPPSLELCVNSIENELTMKRNRGNHRLDFVTVYHIDALWMDEPFLQYEISMYLNDLSLAGFHDDLWEYTWTDIVSGFRRMRHQGMIADIFDVVAKLSRHTVRSLRPSDEHYPDIDDLIDRLNDIPELHFAGDRVKLVVTMADEGCLVPPTHVYDWHRVYNVLTTNTPRTIDEFFVATRPRRNSANRGC